MPNRPALISPLIRPASSQLSSRRGCLVLRRLFVRPSRSTGFPPSSVPQVASSVSLFSTPLELLFLDDHPSANVLELDLAAISMDSITSDVLPLPSLVPLCSPQGHVQAASPFISGLNDREWPLGWESRLSEPCQLGTATSPMIAVLIGRRRY